MPKDNIEIEAMVPLEYWKKNESGTHAQNRALGLSGMLANLGPVRSYKNKITEEIGNQPDKFDPDMPMQLSVIPGFEYNQWDLISAPVTAFSFFLGLASGYFDKSKTKREVDELYNNIIKDGIYLNQVAAQAGKYDEAVKNGVEEKMKSLIKGEEKSTLTEHDLGGLYGDMNIGSSYKNAGFNYTLNGYFNKPEKEGKKDRSEGRKKRVNDNCSCPLIKDFGSYANSILKDVYAKAGKGGEVILTVGPSVTIRGNAEYNSKIHKNSRACKRK